MLRANGWHIRNLRTSEVVQAGVRDDCAREHRPQHRWITAFGNAITHTFTSLRHYIQILECANRIVSYAMFFKESRKFL